MILTSSMEASFSITICLFATVNRAWFTSDPPWQMNGHHEVHAPSVIQLGPFHHIKGVRLQNSDQKCCIRLLAYNGVWIFPKFLENWKNYSLSSSLCCFEAPLYDSKECLMEAASTREVHQRLIVAVSNACILIIGLILGSLQNGRTLTLYGAWPLISAFWELKNCLFQQYENWNQCTEKGWLQFCLLDL